MKQVKTMPRKPSAFSLTELLVVLAILAALTSIALRSVNGVQGQAKYLQTTSTLNQIQNAIIGPANLRGPDGSALVTGFVADTGQLPAFFISQNDTLGANGDPLDQLFVQSDSNGGGTFSFPTYGVATATFDTNVQIYAGWQGPYVRLGAGPTFTRDGWGNSFHVYASGIPTPQTTPIASALTPFAQISSWGLDSVADRNHGGVQTDPGQEDLAGYNRDVSIPNAANLAGGFNVNGTLTGQVTMNQATDSDGIQRGPAPSSTDGGAAIGASLWVVYYGPDSSNPLKPQVVQSSVEVADEAAIAGSPLYWPPTGTIPQRTNFSFTISTNVTIGPRILRAYILPAGTTVLPSSLSSVSAGFNVVESSPLPVTVVGGTQVVPSLVLPHYSAVP